MLDPIQRADLMSAARSGMRGLEGLIQKLKKESPQAFHTHSSLATRVFYHKPSEHTPCCGFIDDASKG